MRCISRILHIRLGEEPMDAWLSWWGCLLGGIFVSSGAIAACWQHAESRFEFVLGAAAGVVAGLLLILLGALARQVHVVVLEGKAGWNSRRWELFSHGVGLVLLALGGWVLAGDWKGTMGAVTLALLV